MRKILWTVLLLVLIGTAGCSPKSAATKTDTPQTTNQSSQSQTQSQSQAQSASKAQSADANSPTAGFTWLNLTDDILSPTDLAADGKPDGHFHVTIPLTEAVKIKYIFMRYSEFGDHVQWAWAYNKSVAIVGSPLAVFVNGDLVSQGTDLGYACSGNTDLDLYVSELNNENGKDTFKFENGQKISLQINYITKTGAEKKFEAATVVNM